MGAITATGRAPMSKIRIGFVGVGGMGQAAHLHHYVSNGDCEVVAIAEIRPKLRDAVQRRWDIAHAHPTHREMLAAHASGAVRLDGIVAIQPFQLHGQLVPELLAAGVPVLTEKPVARSCEAADRVIAAERRHAGSRALVAYHKRSDPATAWVKAKMRELAASRELGRLKYIRVTMPPGDWVAGGFAQNISTDDPAYQGQVSWDGEPAGFTAAQAKDHEAFVNYYIHQVNLLRHLFGEDYRAAYADPSGVALHVQSASGVAGVLEMAPWRSTVDWQEGALVCYEKGWIRLRLFAPLTALRAGEVEFCSDPGGREAVTIRPVLPHVGAMQAQTANFLKAVRGEATDLCGAADAKQDIAIADAYIRLMSAHLAQAKAGT
jgi:predicted dehydrogenase